MSKKVKKTAEVRKKRKTGTWVHSGETVYWLLADIKNVAPDAAEYACFDSTVQLWIKAKNKRIATASANRWLTECGWQVKKPFSITKVDGGTARMVSLFDPQTFSEEEADEWTDHFRVADIEGLDYEFSHYPKPKRIRK